MVVEIQYNWLYTEPNRTNNLQNQACLADLQNQTEPNSREDLDEQRWDVGELGQKYWVDGRKDPMPQNRLYTEPNS